MNKFARFFILILSISPLLIHGQQRKVVVEEHEQRQKSNEVMPNKIQEFVDNIKKLYSNTEEPYATNSKGTVSTFVWHYRLWKAKDLVIIQKENPGTIEFLREAIVRKRMDVLTELLPDFYRNHGGIEAFAAAIKNPKAAAVAEARR
jgi:hypothetical protein